MGQKGSKLDERDAICPSGQNCTPAEAAAIANLTDDARSANTIGWIGLAGGTLLAAGGLALVLTAPRSTATPAETVALVPALGPGFGGISVAGRL